eukprot:TRINITY_DN5402_c0_g1_i2.p1 TRINITY_DN5402_c0_g1~~TRINITY_DN5402_c0_g1_i2.p1  ORF type:complete len:601 (+),score=185.40 TRINITY_DN5402_c0_g1_i2:98-1900(+)
MSVIGLSSPVGRRVETLPTVWEKAKRVEKLEKKKGKFTKDSRWFVLSEDSVLYWFKEKQGRVAQNSIKFDEYNIVDVPGSPKGFRLEGNKPGGSKQVYNITCPSVESKEEWKKLKNDRNFELKLSNNGRMIKRSDLQVSDTLLGEGASGGVKSGTWCGKTVAIKALKNDFSSEEEISEFQLEIEVLAKLNNPHVVRMWGGCVDINKNILLVTEYVGGGDLGKYIHDLKTYPQLQRGVIQKIALNIAHGMKCICEAGLVHKDLKPANILVKDLKKGDIKICDFGLTVATEAYGTPLYAAPELRENPTPAADVFSFAIILWEMHARKQPFWDEPNLFSNQIAEKYKKGVRPPLTNEIEMQGLIKRCWEGDSQSRPDFGRIVDIIHALIESTPNNSQNYDGTSDNLIEKFEGQTELKWEPFKKAMLEVYGASKSHLEALKSILCQHESVTKERAAVFLEKRFANIVHEKVEKPNTWRVSEIAALIGHPWFLDCSTEEAERVVQEFEDGTWMVRFSSIINHLTLASRFKGKTYQMRLKLEKIGPNSMRVSPSDEISFSNVDELVKFYRTNEWFTKDCSFNLGAAYQGVGGSNYDNPTSKSFLAL